MRQLKHNILFLHLFSIFEDFNYIFTIRKRIKSILGPIFFTFNNDSKIFNVLFHLQH